MASKISENLDAMWAAVIGLTTGVSAASFEAYADLFEPNATVYYMGVDAPPSVGREEIVAKIKELLTFWALLERKVMTSAVDEKQRTVAVAMSNKLNIAGKIVEDFKECEIVSFSEKGLIQKYQLFADPTPIKDLLPTGQ